MSAPKKSAILVGCGYYGTRFERHGCENDVRTIEKALQTLRFLPKNIKTLIEPTRENIQNELNNMSLKAWTGDVLCFYFSGLVMNQSDNIPAIYSSDGQFIPATFFQSIANQLPENTSFTFILESPLSARFIDPVATTDKRILFSATQQSETPPRVVPDNDNSSAYGAFTEAIKLALREHELPITNERLLEYVNNRTGGTARLSCIPHNREKNFLEYLT